MLASSIALLCYVLSKLSIPVMALSNSFICVMALPPIAEKRSPEPPGRQVDKYVDSSPPPIKVPKFAMLK